MSKDPISLSYNKFVELNSYLASGIRMILVVLLLIITIRCFSKTNECWINSINRADVSIKNKDNICVLAIRSIINRVIMSDKKNNLIFFIALNLSGSKSPSATFIAKLKSAKYQVKSILDSSFSHNHYIDKASSQKGVLIKIGNIHNLNSHLIAIDGLYSFRPLYTRSYHLLLVKKNGNWKIKKMCLFRIS